MKLLRETTSVCPECLALLPARVFEEGGKVWISRSCAKHGETREVYWSDARMFELAKRYAHDGKGIENPELASDGEKCPFECGLCKRHKSHTALANLVVTNRCDLACWYCFFYRKRNEPVYEPSLAQIRKMLRRLKQQKPVACNAIQLTGGEPTLRDDLIDVIRLCKREGFEHVQLNTNGIRLSRDVELAKRIKEAGVGTLYLSFDGVTPQTNPKNHWEIPAVLENCRAAGIGVVLVPTLIRGVNDHEMGEMIRFALDNVDVVRGINFQPVSIVGMVPAKERNKMRLTIPDAVLEIERQTRGEIARFDFFPVPCVSSVTHFVEALRGKPQYELSAHFACGAATYVFKEGERIIPVTRFIDVPELFSLLERTAEAIRAGKNKTLAKLELAYAVRKLVNAEKKPSRFDATRILKDVLLKGTYDALREFHRDSLFIGMMHFMDLYNYDVERVERCCIHYAMPDGRIVPFCAFNVLPQFYRDSVQKKFSVSRAAWERKHKRKLADDFYKRKLPERELAAAPQPPAAAVREHSAGVVTDYSK
ncbi:MAG: radical SAM protein [Candidatus Norongarragalinales archaeon]